MHLIAPAALARVLALVAPAKNALEAVLLTVREGVLLAHVESRALTITARASVDGPDAPPVTVRYDTLLDLATILARGSDSEPLRVTFLPSRSLRIERPARAAHAGKPRVTAFEATVHALVDEVDWVVPADESASAVERAVSMPAASLSSMIAGVEYAASRDAYNSESAFSTVMLETVGGRVRAVATDGLRLALRSHDGGDLSGRMYLPRTALAAIKRALDADERGDARIEQRRDGSIVITTPSARIVTRPMALRDYPRYEPLLASPREGQTVASFDRAALASAVERVTGFVDAGTNVAAAFSTEGVRLYADREGIGTAEERVPLAEGSRSLAEEPVVLLAAGLLNDAVRRVLGERIDWWVSPLGPNLFVPDGALPTDGVAMVAARKPVTQ